MGTGFVHQRAFGSKLRERGLARLRESGAARFVTLLVVGLLTLSFSACATNPVTGKKEVVLMSEEQEIQLGREADGQIVEQIGVYDDPEVAGWIEQVGQRMAEISHRPDLPWTFRVLDDETVNAMALPGGFVYLTRGMVTHLNSEAEAAGVLGHEIGHITARHTVQQYTKRGFAQIGLGVGSALAPEVAAFQGLLESGLGLLFLKFSRDDERQADELGVEYSHQVGYDPGEFADFFRTIERLGEQREQRIPGWLSTHPDPGDRIERVAELSRSRIGAGDELTVGRDAYLRRVDGIVFGANPREGYTVDSTFKHPDLLFQIDFPRGWEIRNGRRAVAVRSPNEDAFMQLTLLDPDTQDLEVVARNLVERRNGSDAEGGPLEVHGAPAYRVRYTTRVRGVGVVKAVDLIVRYRERVYDIVGLTPTRRFDDYSETFSRSQRSFRPLPREEADEVEPARLDIRQSAGQMRLGAFLEGRESPVSGETIALINGMRLEDRLGDGQLFKIVTGTPPG